MTRHRCHWNRKEIAFLREHYPDKGGAYVAAHLGRTVISIQQQAGRLGLRTLEKLTKKPQPNQRTKLLVGLLSEKYGVTPIEIYSRSRKPNAVTARYALAKALRENGYKYTQIGKQIGRDHTTIILGIRRYAP